MARGRTQRAATVGVAEHGNSAVLVTIAPGGELLDRRRIDLTDRGLPTHPHHHEGSWAVGRYLNGPGARAFRSLTPWRSSSACERPPRAARARASRRWPRRCPCRLRTSRSACAPSFRRRSRSGSPTIAQDPRRLRHVSRGPRDRSRSARLVRALVRPRPRVSRRGSGARPRGRQRFPVRDGSVDRSTLAG